MLRKSLLGTAIAALLIAAPMARATLIAEVESNDTLATAQNVNAAFSLTVDPDIHDQNFVNNSTTVPHASVRAGGGGTGTFDYFRFTVGGAGANGFFDIDASGGDYEIAIWDAAGTLLTQNDDCVFSNGAFVTCNLDPGSSTALDPFIHWTFGPAGDYIVGVARFNANAVNGGWTGNPDVQNYILNIGIEGTVPEPGSLLLAGAAVAGLAGLRRRRVSAS